MKSYDYSWAGECHAVAQGIQDNEQASKFESQGISSAVKHGGSTRINKSSTNGDGARHVELACVGRRRAKDRPRANGVMTRSYSENGTSLVGGRAGKQSPLT